MKQATSRPEANKSIAYFLLQGAVSGALAGLISSGIYVVWLFIIGLSGLSNAPDMNLAFFGALLIGVPGASGFGVAFGMLTGALFFVLQRHLTLRRGKLL